eukprot:6242-Heterococcus_DN1.PRE.4
MPALFSSSISIASASRNMSKFSLLSSPDSHIHKRTVAMPDQLLEARARSHLYTYDTGSTPEETAHLYTMIKQSDMVLVGTADYLL